MRVRTFHSAEGDCLLVSSRDRHHLLVDGGRKRTFLEHAVPTLNEIRAAGQSLDVVCVTHVDRDHIEGVLTLLDAHVARRVADHQHATGNTGFPDPAFDPPQIDAMWHNSFSSQLGDLSDDAAGLVNSYRSALAVPLAATEDEQLYVDVIDTWLDTADALATGIGQGIELAARVPVAGVELNAGFADRIVQRDGPPPTVPVGSMTIDVLAPSPQNLADLRRDWADWVAENQDKVAEIEAEVAAEAAGLAASSASYRADLERLHSVEMADLRHRARLRVTRLAEAINADIANRQREDRLRANRHADRARVTPANRASICLLVEEGGHTILLTGDAHEAEIIDGLKGAGRLDPDHGFHCDVLKVQHHGSEHNVSIDLARRVTADHYLFCGNGSHGNPERSVIKAVIDARLGRSAATNPAAAGPFTLWFNASPEVITGDVSRANFEASLAYARDRARGDDRVSVNVLPSGDSFLEIDL